MKTKLSLISLLALSGALVAAPVPEKKVKVTPLAKPAAGTNAPVQPAAQTAPAAHRLRQNFLQKWSVLTSDERRQIQVILDKHP